MGGVGEELVAEGEEGGGEAGDEQDAEGGGPEGLFEGVE